MAIAFTRTRADLNAPVASFVGAGVMQILYAIVDVTTIAVATNTVDIGYLPKGAIVTGGYFSAVDMDTGTEVLDMDLGITANSAFGGTDSADPDFFMNGGVFSGDDIGSGDGTFVLTNCRNYRVLTGPFPITQLSAKTLVQMITNTAANASGLGKFVVCIHFITPGSATS